MPKLKYALEPGGDKTVEISWIGRWKNTVVQFKGNILGTIPNQKELRKGQIFQLPDGTSLNVQLFTSGLRVLRNNTPLPGSSSDPARLLAQAFQSIYIIAGFNIVLGFIAILFQVEFLQTLGFGIISVAFGFIFLVLGFFTQRRSLVALIFALVIFGLDCVLALINLAPFILYLVSIVATIFNINVDPALRPKAGMFLQINAVFIGIVTFTTIYRAYFLWAMWQGIGAINALKKETPPAFS
jgi:hypothetical protein